MGARRQHPAAALCRRILGARAGRRFARSRRTAVEEAMSSRDGGPLLTVPPGPPTSAILARLEREVRELWVGLPGEPPKSRVCMMNLVVAVTSRAIADRYTTVLDEVTATLPSCAIIVALESTAPTRPL